MSRSRAFLHLVARELGTSDLRTVSLAAFLALYTRIDGDTLVIDPVERELRRELWLVVRSGWLEPLSVKSVGELGSDELELSPEVMDRVRDSCRLVRELGAERIRDVILDLLGRPGDGVAVEPLVERIVEVSRDVDRFLEEVSLVGEVMGFGEAASAT